jgi:hypothetical protein
MMELMGRIRIPVRFRFRKTKCLRQSTESMSNQFLIFRKGRRSSTSRLVRRSHTPAAQTVRLRASVTSRRVTSNDTRNSLSWATYTGS